METERPDEEPKRYDQPNQEVVREPGDRDKDDDEGTSEPAPEEDEPAPAPEPAGQ